MGETLNSFITRAINETMERDGSPTVAADPQAEPQLSAKPKETPCLVWIIYLIWQLT